MTHDEALKALEGLPDEVRDRAVTRLREQGEKFRILKSLVQEGLDDAAAGRVSAWDRDEFLAEVEAEQRTQPRIAQR